MKYHLLSLSIFLFIHNAYAEVVPYKDSEKLQAYHDLKDSPSYAFDAHALFGGTSRDIDLRRFVSSNSVIAGDYSLSTNVNDQFLGQLNLKFKHLDANQSAVLCIDPELIKMLDLKVEILNQLPKKDCLTIKELNTDAYYDLDKSNLKLQISLPLIIINQRPAGYINPLRFDKGISSAFIGYDFNRYTYKYDESTTNNYLNLNAGFNFKGFNFRHAGSFDSLSENLGKYYSYLNALSTDIPSLESRLIIGDFNTQNYASESTSIRGIQLATDLSMRPMSLRSYAPLIKGNAYTNALVSIFQNGRKIYERSVPAGEFEVTDLTAVNNYGDLTVIVTENGGERKSFLVPLQGNINLVRMNQLNYSMAAGQYKLNRETTNENLFQLSFEYGLTNFLSLNAGANLSELFQSINLGGGVNTFLGGLRFDAENSKAKIGFQPRSGQKYQIGYQYNYLPLGLSFSLNKIYQTKEYMTLGNTMTLKYYDELTDPEVDNLFRTYRLKDQTNLAFYQTFKNSKLGSFYINATYAQYWNAINDYVQYNVGYANSWNKLNYSLGVSLTENYSDNRERENRLYFTMSLPLEWNKKRASLYTNIQHNNAVHDTTSTYVGFAGTLGENNQVNYTIASNNLWSDNQNQNTVTASMNYSLPKIQLGVLSGLGENQTQYGLSLKGGVVAHKYGITATNNLTDTFTIIHADGANGASINNAWGSRVDRFGNAIYANTSPYDINTISIDTKDLPLDVNLKSNQTEVVPRRYSSTFIEFTTDRTTNILLNVRTPENVQIPIGVQAKDLSGKVIGMFGQSNQLFLDDMNAIKNEIILRWGEKNEKLCTIPIVEKEIKPTKNKLSFQIVNVECK